MGSRVITDLDGLDKIGAGHGPGESPVTQHDSVGPSIRVEPGQRLLDRFSRAEGERRRPGDVARGGGRPVAGEL
ncbi:MAG: hypothetical protein QOD96_5549, partial [Pseudonocardiales bacterium]|nr:hypothetical protein [Pseudonocardiales bacterium]